MKRLSLLIVQVIAAALTGLTSLEALKATAQDVAHGGSFAFTFTTKAGSVVEAKAVANRLSFVIRANIPLDASIPFAPEPDNESTRTLTGESLKPEQAAAETLEVSGMFVAPNNVKLKRKTHRGVVWFRLQFLGEKK